MSQADDIAYAVQNTLKGDDDESKYRGQQEFAGILRHVQNHRTKERRIFRQFLTQPEEVENFCSSFEILETLEENKPGRKLSLRIHEGTHPMGMPYSTIFCGVLDKLAKLGEKELVGYPHLKEKIDKAKEENDWERVALAY
ncbi:hypothetical protein OIO90_004330 [Microbotryomycetes sp. JL221]|nr:hypothetical protein OIO90_004330 [Microbotryomycetes sp. JL221]